MTLTLITEGAVVVAEPAGAITAQSAVELETRMQERLAAGIRQIVVDFTRVEMVAGDGIRVLMLLAEQLRGLGGGLILCSLPNDVRRVFEVANLTDPFRMVSSRAEGIAALATISAPLAAPAAPSKLARVVGRLLDAPPTSSTARPTSGQPASKLQDVIAKLLSTS